MVLTASNSARPRFCEGCGGFQYVHINLTPASTRHHYGLVMGLVKIRGYLFRCWVCSDCVKIDDAGTRFPPQAEPVRPEIVSAIRRLKAAGHRFFEWEKK